MDNITSLQITDGKVGTGAEATAGKTVTVHYTGWLYDPKTADHTRQEVRQLAAITASRSRSSSAPAR